MTEPGPILGYDTDALRSGGDQAGEAAGAAENALSGLQGTAVRAGAFGEFTGSTRVAGGVGATRDTFARTAHDVHAHHTALDGRAHDTAAQGDQLVTDTTTTARQGGPSGTPAAGPPAADPAPDPGVGTTTGATGDPRPR